MLNFNTTFNTLEESIIQLCRHTRLNHICMRIKLHYSSLNHLFYDSLNVEKVTCYLKMIENVTGMFTDFKIKFLKIIEKYFLKDLNILLNEKIEAEIAKSRGRVKVNNSNMVSTLRIWNL